MPQMERLLPFLRSDAHLSIIYPTTQQLPSLDGCPVPVQELGDVHHSPLVHGRTGALVSNRSKPDYHILQGISSLKGTHYIAKMYKGEMLKPIIIILPKLVRHSCISLEFL